MSQHPNLDSFLCHEANKRKLAKAAKKNVE